ncbi:MAG: hypothetical protein GX074_01885 [Erysipelothrix sp.]|nr:hypothetical protein [Erysipelothrix sp.]
MKLILQDASILSDEQIGLLENLGYEIAVYNNEEIDGEVFVGILRPPFEELKNIKGLKFIQSTIAGYDFIDMDAVNELNILFANGSGVGSAPIAEYVLHSILDYYRDAARFRQYQIDKHWGSRKEANGIIQELASKRVLVLGTGAIGQATAKRLQAFDVYTIGVNSNGRQIDCFDECLALDDVYDHLADVDVVVAALPLNDATRAMFNQQFFEAMKLGSIFINVGRGPQVIEDDLVNALSNHLGHAYLDVFNVEPLASDSVLWQVENLSVTPHISSSSVLVNERTRQLIMDNLDNYISSKPLLNLKVK